MNFAEEVFQGFNFSHDAADIKTNLPIHLQLVERSEFMKKLETNESSSSLGSLTPESSSSLDSPDPPSFGKHRYSTYYERLPFFKNPFSPNNRKAQKLNYLTSSISPNSSKFVLVHCDKWLVYSVNADEPTLLCCGKINGDHGPDFDSLTKESRISLKNKSLKYKSCAINERLLVLTCTDGSLRVHDMMECGKLLYQYGAGLQIESVDISPKNEMIACGLQGRNKETRGSIILVISLDFKKPKMADGLTPELVAKLNGLSLGDGRDFASPPQKKFLKKIGSKSSLKNLKKAAEKQNESMTVSAPVLELKLYKSDRKLITVPYHGIVDNVKFSSTGDRLIFSTYKSESKFVVFDVTKPLNIKLLMKSSRTPEKSPVSEGITDFQLFGKDDSFMLISSNSPNAPPMILNTKIDTIVDKDQKPVQPKRVLRLDGLGSKVHKCCINSTNDLAAFLTTDGKIWLAQLTKDELQNYILKKLELIDKVSGSSCYKNTASMRFSPDGTKMLIVDLKGVMFVQNFSSILNKRA